ncbi:hypothetical protein Tco_1099696 [Tanacetum coccineum]
MSCSHSFQMDLLAIFGPDFLRLASFCLIGALVRTIIGFAQHIGTCLSSLLSSKAALILSAEVVRYITNTSPLIREISLLSASKKGSDFLAPFDSNQLSAANFLLRLCMSLSDLGGGDGGSMLYEEGEVK